MEDRAKVHILPPLVLIPILVSQAVIGALAPTRMMASNAAIVVGVGVIAIAVVIVIAAARELASARTAFDARKSTSALVTTGIFRFSRNPAYLSMVLLVTGIGVALNSPWALLLAIPTGSLLCLAAIRPEERYLETKFARACADYRSAVPRWFSAYRIFSSLAGR
jgi:protein-S-isoprenylcysteine O-methyltransferase Ste14